MSLMFTSTFVAENILYWRMGCSYPHIKQKTSSKKPRFLLLHCSCYSLILSKPALSVLVSRHETVNLFDQLIVWSITITAFIPNLNHSAQL